MSEGEKVGDVARRFGVNPQTVRQWAEQFSPFLSPDANPNKGGRAYSVMKIYKSLPSLRICAGNTQALTIYGRLLIQGNGA